MFGKIALFTLLIDISHAFAADAPISSVTLYPGSATIVRTVQVSTGLTKIDISDVPANFDPKTIRVEADAGIQVGQVTTRDTSHAEAVSAREAELEARIEALQNKSSFLDVETRSAALVQKYLENIGSNGASGATQQPLVDARSMAAMIEAVRRGGYDAFERMHKAELQKREIDKQITALQRDLEKLRSGTRDSRQITLQIAVHQPGRLKVSYQVNNAGWKPTYRAILDSDASTVTLERLAVVSQKTGEDWGGVAIKLSTGQPQRSLNLPEPQPWLLSYRKPLPPHPTVYGIVDHASAPMPTPAPAARFKSNENGEDYIPPVIETQGNFASEFDVPSKVTLPSDGREVIVALSRQSIPVKLRLRAVPRLETTAVITAEAPRPEGVWLPGTIQLLRDTSYAGETRWDPQASDKFMFSFGRDDLVRVTVNRTAEKTGTSGLLSQPDRRISDVYSVTSFHKKPIDVLVLEASPVSTAEEVKVKTAFQPQPTIDRWEQRPGVIGWETTIAPKQTLKFNVDYVIGYPKEGTVTGLP